MESGILPKQFGRSDISDGVEVLGESESRTMNIGGEAAREPTPAGMGLSEPGIRIS